MGNHQVQIFATSRTLIMKLKFDLSLSKELCKPELRPDVPKGATFVERIIAPRNKVAYILENQNRVLNVVQSDVTNLKTSFLVNGWVHSEYPPMAMEDEDRKGMYLGLSGFNRDAAAEELGSDEMMYDVYKFDTPLIKRLTKNKSNLIRTPRSPNTKEDLIFQTLQAIEYKEISNTDDEIKWFIDEIAADKSVSERKNIFKKVRENKSSFSNILTYHSRKGINSTMEAAKKLKIACKGDENITSSGKLGYIPPYANPTTNFRDAKKLIKKHGFQDIEFHFYIPEASGDAEVLKQQRVNTIRIFKTAVREEAEWIQTIMEKLGHTHELDEIINVLPYKAKGFLPQYKNPDPKKGGLPTETDVVSLPTKSKPVQANNILKFVSA